MLEIRFYTGLNEDRNYFLEPRLQEVATMDDAMVAIRKEWPNPEFGRSGGEPATGEAVAWAYDLPKGEEDVICVAEIFKK